VSRRGTGTVPHGGDQFGRTGQPRVRATLGGHPREHGPAADRAGHRQAFPPAAGEQRAQQGSRTRLCDGPLHDGHEPVGRSGALRHQPLHPAQIGVGLAPHEGPGEAVLAAELVVEGLAGDARCGGDVDHPYPGPGLVTQGRESGVQQ
jgi:hypothetical protein